MPERFTEPDSTLIVVVLDKSGSMAGRRADTIGGFNTFLAEQSKGPDPARMVVIDFNEAVRLLVEATPILDVLPLTPERYVPAGNTALYDAVAYGIQYGAEQRTPNERVLMLTITDGEENSSRTATLASIKAEITSRQAGEWTFLFIGPDPEKWARQTGNTLANTSAYQPQAAASMFVGASNATTSYRTTTAWSSPNTQLDEFTKAAVDAAKKQSNP